MSSQPPPPAEQNVYNGPVIVISNVKDLKVMNPPQSIDSGGDDNAEGQDNEADDDEDEADLNSGEANDDDSACDDDRNGVDD